MTPVDGRAVVAGATVVLSGLRPPDELAVAAQVLCAADAIRAAAFRRPDDRARFLTGRLLVAEHLRDAFGLGPGDYEVHRPTHEPGEWRPVLVPRRAGVQRLPHFSISHSGAHVLLAVHPDTPVGVDIERLDAFDALPGGVEDQYLTRRERACLPAGPARRSALGRAFTRKEAVLKAIGHGLAVDPLTLDLDDSGPSPRVVRFDAPEARPVTLRDLGVPLGYVAALAVCRGPVLSGPQRA